MANNISFGAETSNFLNGKVVYENSVTMSAFSNYLIEVNTVTEKFNFITINGEVTGYNTGNTLILNYYSWPGNKPEIAYAHNGTPSFYFASCVRLVEGVGTVKAEITDAPTDSEQNFSVEIGLTDDNINWTKGLIIAFASPGSSPMYNGTATVKLIQIF